MTQLEKQKIIRTIRECTDIEFLKLVQQVLNKRIEFEDTVSKCYARKCAQGTQI